MPTCFGNVMNPVPQVVELFHRWEPDTGQGISLRFAIFDRISTINGLPT